MIVRHASREVSYDWSDSAFVHWAAFFSDCEHEVLPVTAGHRTTLAYNLFWTHDGPALMAENFLALDQSSLYFYESLRALLNCRDFLPQGLSSSTLVDKADVSRWLDRLYLYSQLSSHF